jgi:hypothetical protein
MAYVLSLRPQSPLKRSFSDNPYLRSCSSLKDAPISALRDITLRNASACSLYSLAENRAGEWLRGIENTPPPLTSHSLLDLGHDKDIYGLSVRAVDHAPRKRNCPPSRPPPLFPRDAAPAEPYSKKSTAMEQVTKTSSNEHVTVECVKVDDDNEDEEVKKIFNIYDAINIPLPEGRFSDNTGSEYHNDVSEDVSVAIASNQQLFRRWMSTLRRRHVRHRKDNVSDAPRWSVDLTEGEVTMLAPSNSLPESLRQRSGSFSSSLACVTAMKSASITVASASIAPRSDAGGFQGKPCTGHRSSGFSDVRKSTDSHTGALAPIIDESAWLRSLQRRKIVEELISSEESYVADLKVLINVSLSLRRLYVR